MNSQYIDALIGGVIIGLSTLLLLYFNGKIAGISGIIANSINTPRKENFWRYAFLFGLFSGSFIVALLDPSKFSYPLRMSATQAILGGLLVGFGTRVGSGCTSGHGVCGVSRLSSRSLVATITFIISAIITVFVLNLFKVSL